MPKSFGHHACILHFNYSHDRSDWHCRDAHSRSGGVHAHQSWRECEYTTSSCHNSQQWWRVLWLPLGDPFSTSTAEDLTDRRKLNSNQSHDLQARHSKMATLHLGGGCRSKEGYFTQTIIFMDCTPHMNEDIFLLSSSGWKKFCHPLKLRVISPLTLSLHVADSEVIEATNTTTYGLTASVLTASPSLSFKLNVVQSWLSRIVMF